MKYDDETVDIREVQHYAYCPHRWGLIHIACDWSENAFVNKAKIIHEAADSGKSVVLRGRVVERAVQVYNDEWGIFGVLDCLELTPDESGCYLARYGKKFSLAIIEYKPTSPSRKEASAADRMQLLAQKICADSMFGTSCKTFFYYADARKRVEITFEEADYAELTHILREIRNGYSEAKIPSVRKKQYCGGCSMKDICLPKAGKDHA